MLVQNLRHHPFKKQSLARSRRGLIDVSLRGHFARLLHQGLLADRRKPEAASKLCGASLALLRTQVGVTTGGIE